MRDVYARCKCVARQHLGCWVAFAKGVKLAGHPPIVGVTGAEKRASYAVTGRVVVVWGEVFSAARSGIMSGESVHVAWVAITWNCVIGTFHKK